VRTLATWCFRHRRTVLLLWISAFILATGVARATGTDFSNSFTLPNTPSTEAIAILQSVSPKNAGDTERIVFESSKGLDLASPAVRERIDSTLEKVAALPHVVSVVSPYSLAGGSQVSRDGTIEFATVDFNVLGQSVSTNAATTFVDTAVRASERGLTVAVSGQIAEKSLPVSLGGAGPGVLLAGIVLLLVFGSLLAMALPLVSALASLGTAIGIIDLLSNVMKMPEFSTQLVLLIGLGVGIDYALFIVTRHRQGLMAGLDVETSVVNAVDTSGRAVLFAGIIVCIALLGMLALGVSFLYGLAVSAAIGVAFTMLASLTLLPAMLGFIGPKVMGRRQRRRLKTSGPRIVGQGTTGFWTRWAGFQSRRPLIAAIGALVIIVVVALPFFSLRLGTSDQGNDPAGTTTRVAYDLLAKGFGPGYNGPLTVVVVDHHDTGTAPLSKLRTALAAHSDVASVSPVLSLPARGGTTVSLLEVFPNSAPQAASTTTLIDQLRGSTIPAAVKGTGLEVLVGGTTAIFVDFERVLSSKLPLFIGLVIVLSFLLLALVFRSIVIPLTAAVMNILSIGAAFGVLVSVFQNGTLGGLFGVNRPGPVESFLPVMLFAILFGLSMDYEVFLLTRIHEEWLRCGDNRLAVRRGLAATGKTITAAALIMILIFGSFILGGERVIKEFGLGLAAGIFMDALLIRMAIVPAVMFLFGESNWWFPKWLDRALPKISVDPVDALQPAVEPAVGEPRIALA
jgi:putative drug exporter of the RND superfamily